MLIATLFAMAPIQKRVNIAGLKQITLIKGYYKVGPSAGTYEFGRSTVSHTDIKLSLTEKVKVPQCISTDEQKSKMWYVHAMDLSAKKGRKI